MENSFHQNTIIALATAIGHSAIGTLRLSGKDAISIVNEVFVGKDLREQPPNTTHYGKIVDNGVFLDEVMVTLFHAPRSYTGEQSVEVSGHGSPFILEKLLQCFLGHGAELATPGEFTMRAFLNGKLDLIQAESVVDIIAADSEATHKAALHSMRGGFSREIDVLRERLIHFASLIELELDFSEEDVEFANREQLSSLLSELKNSLQVLCDSFALGNAIKKGIPVVIAGKPNVGKSTLLNILLQEDRAIVSDIAGTTRDVIEADINIGGLRFRLIDTAGIRDAMDKIEAIGIAKTHAEIKQAFLVVYVFDVSLENRDEIGGQLRSLNNVDMPVVLVGNKIDLAKDNNYVEAFEPNYSVLFVSASDFKRHDQIRDDIKQLLVEEVKKNMPASNATIVTNVRHFTCLSNTLGVIKEVEEGLEKSVSSDLLAIDLRRALHYLGELTGRISSDDLLENIFRNFCIGK